MHHGCAPSRLGAALAEALAAQEREQSSAGPDRADTGCSTGHWRSSWGWQAAHFEYATRSVSGMSVDETAALSPTIVPTEPAQEATEPLRPKRRRTTLAAAMPAGSAAPLSQPAVEATRASASVGATAAGVSGDATAGDVGDAARRAAVVAAVNAALAERVQGGAASPPSTAVAPGVGSGVAPTARGEARQATGDASEQARRARAFGFGRGRR